MSLYKVAGPLGPSLQPPRTVKAVVKQARDAFRRYREGRSQMLSDVSKQQQEQQMEPQGSTRLILQLPVPVAADAKEGVAPMEQSFSLFDEGDWPGGIVQRFRALRPLVEATLEGYNPEFLGMLESPADGLGCWTLPDTTLCGIATNATFSSFAKLCEGGYGSKPLQAGHTVIAVNPDWTGAQDIGQFWERKLKAAAEVLLAPNEWQTLYSCKMIRTSRGRGYGVLVGSYGLGWHLWAAQSEDSSSVVDADCLLWSQEKPEQSVIIEKLDAAAKEAKLRSFS